MVQSFLPLSKMQRQMLADSKQSRLGVELALPLTMLGFILVAEVSPTLKMHLEHIVDWLCDHDLAANSIELMIALIPVWMLSVMLYDKFWTRRAKRN